jgi:gliding motility-associated-like protein
MKKIYCVLCAVTCLLITHVSNAQGVTTCFEIQSILVDACAPSGQEGQNEMVRFQVGPNALNTSNLNVIWATLNNPWLGVCQDESTASKVAALNETIEGCGFLLEPTDGILPPNSRVILVTGINMDVPSNSFASLTDTLYMLFHCGTSNQGHFANAGDGIRQLTMSFAEPQNCSDEVQYDRALLVGGDGATVEFDADNNATYVNNGCNAPYVPASAEWSLPAGVTGVCASEGAVNLNDFIIGTPGGVWSGFNVVGNTFIPTGLSGPFPITYTIGAGACAVSETNDINVLPASSAAWQETDPICSSSVPIVLSSLVTGTQGGIFSGQGVTNNIFNPSGLLGSIEVTYTVGEGACQAISSQIIEVISGPDASWQLPPAICQSSEPFDLMEFVTGTPGGTFVGEGVADNIFFPEFVNGNVALSYSISENGCSAILQQTVSIILAPNPPVVNGESSICEGASTSLLATGLQGAEIIWYSDEALTQVFSQGAEISYSGAETITFFVTQGLGGECISTATEFTVEVSQLFPSPVSQPVVSVCEGADLPLLSASSQGEIFWFNDAELSNLVGNGETFQPTAALGNTYFLVTGTGECASLPVQVVLTEVSLITAELEVIGSLTLCAGDEVTLRSSSETNNLWSTTATSQEITVNQPGVYSLTVSGACNTIEDEVEVISEAVEANFTLDPAEGQAPLLVNFANNSNNSDLCTWFINGTQDDSPATGNVTFTEGDYEIKLVCTNTAGCSDSITRSLVVNSDVIELLIPNSFTPNGDGMNDFFKPKAKGIVTLDATIYNRWGQLIHQFTGPDTSWDGTANGRVSPDGVYFYVIRATDFLNKDYEEKGSITLIR